MDDNFELSDVPGRKVPTASPRYQIVSSTDRTSVSKGETTTFSFYLTGYGEIERHKMTAFLDYDALLSSEGGSISIPFAQDEDGGIMIGKPALESDRTFHHSIESNSATMYLSNILLHDSPSFSPPPEDDSIEALYPTIIAEGDWGDHAPIEIELNISEDANPGDYEFQLYFFYSDRLELYQTQSKVEIHVQNKVEEYEPWPQRFAIIGGLIALISLLYQTGLFTSILTYFNFLQ